MYKSLILQGWTGYEEVGGGRREGGYHSGGGCGED